MIAFRKQCAQTSDMAATRTDAVARAEVDAVLDACRSLVAISAWSVEAVADRVDLVELRILVVLATRGASSLKDLADTVHLHLTRSSRACDRLVGKKLITRTDHPGDRRVLQLALTRSGAALVQEVMAARRDAVAPVLAAMSATRRAELVRSLRAFAAASGELGGRDVSALAWTE
jgi:DNA-binding MarR family transcriptional regulator